MFIKDGSTPVTVLMIAPTAFCEGGCEGPCGYPVFLTKAWFYREERDAGSPKSPEGAREYDCHESPRALKTLDDLAVVNRRDFMYEFRERGRMLKGWIYRPRLFFLLAPNHALCPIGKRYREF